MQSKAVEVGKLIRKYRLKMNLSQEALAEKTELHRTYIGLVERGVKNITLKNLLKIAESLGIKVNQLIKNL